MLERLPLIPALLVVLVTASPALGSDYIKLKNGDRMKGDAVVYDDDAKVLTFRTEDDVEHQLALDDLDGRSVYHVTRSKVSQDNGSGQLQLANYARDIELYAHAVRHYKYAARADPALQSEVDKQMAVLRSAAARWAMGRAQDGIKKKDMREAEKWLTAIIEKLPDEPEAAIAQAMLGEHHKVANAARDDELERKMTVALEADAKTARRYYDRMLDQRTKGLTGKSSSAVSNFEGAIRDGKRASSELDKLMKKYSDPDTVEVLLGYQEIIQDVIVETHLHLASHYTTRTNYNKAQSEVNKVLAVDPSNLRALEARARIESAMNDGWGVFR
jgi:tetratricopeptide (TPR) repeat protein